jgi:hypothetical protein
VYLALFKSVLYFLFVTARGVALFPEACEWILFGLCTRECDGSTLFSMQYAYFLTYEGHLKSSWTGSSASLLCRGRHNSITAAHCRKFSNFSNGSKGSFKTTVRGMNITPLLCYPTTTTWHKSYRLPLHNSGALPPVHEIFKRLSYFASNLRERRKEN